MSDGRRTIRVTLHETWRLPARRGLLDVDPRVRTLCRVLVSYPEVRYIVPDRVSVEAIASAEVLQAIARFLGRQQWLVRDVEVT